jgi:uncharacterized protein YlxW (UPF0749 family)
MTAITEDTPEGGPEELQWKIDRLIEQVERHTAELERERRSHRETQKSLTNALEKSLNLTSRLTVGVLRKAGFTVTIEDAGFCEACGEDF